MLSFIIGLAIGWYIESIKDQAAALVERVRSWL